jgi:hypothetical protein
MNILSIASRLLTGANEAFVIEIDTSFQPSGVGDGTHH